MAPETIASRYHVERPIGKGGMGTVWLCRDELLGRHVAVKQVGTLPGEATPDLARALREARSSAALNHPNVVSIFDAVEEGDHIWLVMEYVPGRTLSEIVAQDGPVTPERAARIGAQIAEGLAAAHARGTIHRDVKPGNILVTDHDTAKVSDFGIARTHGDAALTHSGMVTGTPLYFSPELARGEDPTPAADVWALGATLYAAVEGHPPYPAQRNPIAMLTTIAEGHPPRPERAAFLTGPIGRMLDPDPASRWSMADAAHTLRRLHEQHAGPDTAQQTAAFAAPARLTEPAQTEVHEVAAVAADTAAEELEPRSDHPGTAVAAPAGAGAAASGPASRSIDDDRTPRNRAGLLLALGGFLLLCLVAFVGYSLATDGDEGSGAGDTPATSPGTGGDNTPRAESSAEPPEESEPTSDPDTSEPTTSASVTDDAQGFVRSYYGMLPDDPETAWTLLSPAYQAEAGPYGRYAGFWGTISSVTVDDVQPAGSGAVDVTLTYVKDSGDADSEVRRILLERDGDGYLIAGSYLV